LTGFENRLTNLIDFDFTTFTNVNVGRARTRGLEARLGFKAPRVRLFANATVLDAVDQTTGLPLLRRPGETASLRLSIPRQGWSLHLTGLYVGPRDDVDPVTSVRAENGGYFRFDLAGQRRVDGPLTPYARVENLNDREYAEALGFPAPGRTFIGGLMIGWE
jgi:outer membrane cobalamin receptor